MRAAQKQLKFFFPDALFYATIASVVIFLSGNCFALEQHPPFSYYDVIEQRNIFRPKTEAPDTSQQAEPVPLPLQTNISSGLDNYVLTGVVKIRGKYKATITDKSSESGYYVAKGELISNLKIIDIQHDRVILEQDNQTYELKINAQASRIIYQKPVAEKETSTKTITPKEDLSSNDNTMPRTNIMKSIRMGTPNVQRQ